METITHLVGALDPAAREALARLVGHPLSVTNEIVIQVRDTSASSFSPRVSGKSAEIPSQFRIFENLTEEEDQAIQESLAARSVSREMPAP